MIIEYVRYRIPLEKAQEFEADYRAAMESLQRSEHCLACELSRCEEEPARYILRIEWSSTKDHLEGFRKSPEFRQFLPKIRGYIEDLEEMQHYAPLDIQFRKPS